MPKKMILADRDLLDSIHRVIYRKKCAGLWRRAARPLATLARWAAPERESSTLARDCSAKMIANGREKIRTTSKTSPVHRQSCGRSG
jgi:hypothetical protein